MATQTRVSNLWLSAAILWSFIAFLLGLNLQFLTKDGANSAYSWKQKLKDDFVSGNNIHTPLLYASSEGNKSTCDIEYDRIAAARTPGMTAEDLQRATYAWTGNRYNLAQVAEQLYKRPVVGIAMGGSITMGHGVHPHTLRYAERLEEGWNKLYPLPNGKKHKVILKASHGADICALAKRVQMVFKEFREQNVTPDLFILEFSVNDYQGQDHELRVDHKTDLFFEGFQSLAICAEVVIHTMRTTYPDAAIVFLEMQTAILNRKTAFLLHLGVAQHYQIPVISPAEFVFPSYYRLMEKLRPNEFHAPVNDTVFPFPHGCHACLDQYIDPSSRKFGCKSICVFQMRTGDPDAKKGDCRKPPPGFQECYPPFFAHDAVHPGQRGHQMVCDLIIDALASARRHSCFAAKRMGGHVPFQPNPLPMFPWLASPKDLATRSNFISVRDTMQIFAKQVPLMASSNGGFGLIRDEHGRTGWLTEGNLKGGEWVEFTVNLPKKPCYAIVLSVLKSYNGMAQFTVDVKDMRRNNKTTTTKVDGLWKPHISVPADVEVTADSLSNVGCTGFCTVRVTVDPRPTGREGVNRVKVMSLSVRECYLEGNIGK